MSKKITTIIFLMFFFLNLCSQTNSTNRIYEVWDDKPAPNRGNDGSIRARGYPYDHDWEYHSMPIGNGYMGANIFGRTDMERIQITDKTLTNGAPYGSGGLTNFAEVFLEFDHYDISNYRRSLNLNEAISYVSYEYEGVTYSREHLANYPNNIIAIKLSASKQAKISCTVSAVNPYLRNNNEMNHSFLGKDASKAIITPLTKSGTVKAEGNTITLSGNVPGFNLNYEGQIKIINDGGKLYANNENGSNEIRIVDANSAIILIATGTNYMLSDKIFLADSNHLKLDPKIFPHDKVTKVIEEASALGYVKLKESHLKDYQNLFSRVSLELTSTVPQIPTRTLVENYQQGGTDVYLEELMFHFGRYLLIASSRPGTLPTTLQGVWSQYHVSPWSAGYWHNINVQMNYWSAFNTNLYETFIAYEEYFNAYLPRAYKIGSKYIKKWHPDAFSNEEKGNGWSIGTGANAYAIGTPGGHSGPGTGGFTTKLFWDRFAFTQDTTYLRETAYPALLGMSKFLSKTLLPSEDGKLLVDRSASPEQKHNGKYYMTKGTTFDQAFVWETYNDLLKSARILGTNDEFLETVKNQINKLDPIIIGASGQIKEYREENEYGEIGDPKHRHLSHLCALYPGTLINSGNPEWVNAVSTVLNFRGTWASGWGMAHRMTLRARTKEAEEAHIVYARFLKERTLTSLWCSGTPFQIDGNFGVMAGIAEMLIQSHEGFIEVLPTLPKEWETGSFDGLVARGNFEVTLEWEKSKISSFKVHSRSGGKCSIKHPYPEKAQILDMQGNTISHIMKTDNIIEFNTNKSGQYIIAF